MIIGALRLSFLVPSDGSSSRGLGQKVKVALQTRFKAAACEIPAKKAEHSELTVGATLVSCEERQMKNRLDEIVRYFQDWGHAELVHHDIEVIHFDDIEIERDFEKYDP